MDYSEIFKRLLSEQHCLSKEDIQHYYANDNIISDCYIITMANATKKYSHAAKLLGSLGISSVKFTAVDGKKIKADDPIRTSFSNLRDGELGCLVSHSIMLYMASTHPKEDQWTFICEDDITSTHRGTDMYEHLKSVIEELNEKEISVDMLYLGKCLETCGKMAHYKDGLYYAVDPSCTHAFLYKNSFARKVMKEYRDYDMGIDGIFAGYIKNKKIKALNYHPSIFYQDVFNFNSDLRSKKDQNINYLECKDASRNDNSYKFMKHLPLRIIVALFVSFILYVILSTYLSNYSNGIIVFASIIVFLMIVILSAHPNMISHCDNIEGYLNKNMLSRPTGLKPINKLKIIDVIINIPLPDDDKFKYFNPSIVAFGNNYHQIVRASNEKFSYGVYSIMDMKMNIIDEYVISPQYKHINENMPEGYEDFRIFIYNDKLWCTAVNIDCNDTSLLPRMVIIDIEKSIKDDTMSENCKKDYIISLTYAPIMDRPNKNWSPLVFKDKLYFIIDVDPLLIVKPNIKTGVCTKVYEGRNNHKIEYGVMRNSSVCICLRKSIYMLAVHSKYIERDIFSKTLIHYEHRLMIIDMEHMSNTKLSKPFNIEEDGLPHIEYISSIWLLPETKELLIGYGLNDSVARYCTVSFKTVNELFEEKVL